MDHFIIKKNNYNIVSYNATTWSPELRRLEREVVARLSA
jgi:hypothetical protein